MIIETDHLIEASPYLSTDGVPRYIRKTGYRQFISIDNILYAVVYQGYVIEGGKADEKMNVAEIVYSDSRRVYAAAADGLISALLSEKENEKEEIVFNNTTTIGGGEFIPGSDQNILRNDFEFEFEEPTYTVYNKKGTK